jgi:hypothetical protein
VLIIQNNSGLQASLNLLSPDPKGLILLNNAATDNTQSIIENTYQNLKDRGFNIVQMINSIPESRDVCISTVSQFLEKKGWTCIMEQPIIAGSSLEHLILENVDNG